MATIEPFHGTHLVLYQNATGSDDQKPEEPTQFPNRLVLDDQFKQGHAIAVGDLFGNGDQQIVAGWRNPNDDRVFGVKLYYPSDKSAGTWESVFIDEKPNGM